MAITKNPLIRYKILDSCFRNPYKKFTKELLLETLNNKLIELFDDESYCIKLRQMQEDIAFMKSSEGWSIELTEEFDGKKRIFRYEDLNFSINNAPLNELELNEFKAAIQTLAQFEGIPQFEGIKEIVAKLQYDSDKDNQSFIGFENNQDLKGMEHFSLLYNATQKQIPLEITYQDFKSEHRYTFILHPYYLKQYNSRWFLFGLNEEADKSDWNVAIDRIVNLETSNKKFIPNKSIDWQDYFSDMIGVTKPIDSKPEEIVLHFYGITGKYMENKPLHETQKQKWINDETLELKIKVISNYELERLILSYGESIKVIEPKYLKEIIKNRIKNNVNLYCK